MEIMRYKGYWAEIRYSEEDKCFYGVVEGLNNDRISFEGKDKEELKKDFQDAIEDYIQLCREQKKNTERQLDQ